MYSGLVVATCNKFNQGNPDKNGEDPVILVISAGKAPNRTVLAGTVAKNNNFEVGKTYLVSIRETGYDDTVNPSTNKPYGRRFNFINMKEMGTLEIIQAEKLLGPAVMFDVETEEGARRQPVSAGAGIQANTDFDDTP